MKFSKPYINFILCLLLVACDSSIKYPEGGYDYPKHVADKDTNFYYYPLKDIMPKKDSLLYTSTYLLFKEFDEPNLSLRPFGYDVFRLQYGESLGGYYIITVTRNFIHVKKEIFDDENLFDQNMLSQGEQKIYRIFRRNYPFDNLNEYMQRYVDSIKSVNPKILQPEYFVYLMKKKFKPIDPKKVYALTTIKITDRDFNHLVEIINKSGYWKMPYAFPSDDCCTDGYGYSLEANTAHKYNFATATISFDSSKQRINFSKACQEIIKYAHLEKEISLWDDSKTDTSHIVIQDVQLEEVKPPPSKYNKKHHK